MRTRIGSPRGKSGQVGRSDDAHALGAAREAARGGKEAHGGGRQVGADRRVPAHRGDCGLGWPDARLAGGCPAGPEHAAGFRKGCGLDAALRRRPSRPGISVRQIAGGYLAQQRDNITIQLDDLKVVTDREPTPEELENLIFAFQVCKHVKSNAIVYAKNQATVGIGAGQMSRVDSSRIAALKALDAASSRGEATSPTISSVVASDAFFPFADGQKLLQSK